MLAYEISDLDVTVAQVLFKTAVNSSRTKKKCHILSFYLLDSGTS